MSERDGDKMHFYWMLGFAIFLSFGIVCFLGAGIVGLVTVINLLRGH